MNPTFELFDHTADIGIRAKADTPAGLVYPAIQGLYAVLGKLIPTTEQTTMLLEVPGDSRAMLLRDLLGELLFAFDHEHQMVVSAEVDEFTDSRLAVDIRISPIDMDNSELEREIKAVTYHELDLRQTATGYEAQFIVDI